ncbi:MAG: hypothetical protein Q8N19_12745 [Phenylobacterium sp.]|uniref:hypothetical protein n=1 Tax=Phenylobacterium sp. TaxID=1871053 RepID=UPI0027366CBC|nr:hypothetical protein [Phenylobacterium sp.]MDP3117969.1 hypothetical protein [Phenylobacterium sp.]
MTDTNGTEAAQADTFFDISEVHQAIADPLYKTSERYRSEVASKLTRSQAAGTVGRMGEQITHAQRTHTVNAVNLAEGTYGGAQPMPKPAPPLSSIHTFSSLDQINAVMSSDSYRDPTYRQGVVERIERSIRAGTLDDRALAQVAAWQAAAQGGR